MQKFIGTMALLAFNAGAAFGQTSNAPPAPEKDVWDGYAFLGGALDGRTGVELEFRAKFKPASWVEFGISPANFVFYEDETDQYETDSFSNGQTRCRNTDNGQFADDSHCAPAIDWRGTVTGEFNLGDNFSVGGGYLIGDGGSPFGSLRYNFNSSFALQGRAGDDYGSIAFVLMF